MFALAVTLERSGLVVEGGSVQSCGVKLLSRSPKGRSLTANEASVAQHLVLVLLLTAEISERVDDDTEDEIQQNNDDDEEEEKVVQDAGHK